MFEVQARFFQIDRAFVHVDHEILDFLAVTIHATFVHVDHEILDFPCWAVTIHATSL